jgi:predicted naringenin-chalcone synthase
MVAPTIVQTATAVPAHVLDQDTIKRALCELLPLSPRKLEAAMALFDHALVERRHSVLPIAQLRTRRTLSATTRVYREHAVELARVVAERCLTEAGVAAAEVDLVISVSCTGVMIPSLDAHLANDLHLRPDIRRLPITELGCVAGAAALNRAHDYLRGHPEGHVLIVAVELPTLSFQRDDTSLAQLVSTALFGDGAAACLVSAAPTATALPVREVTLGTDGTSNHLVALRYGPGSGVELHLEGTTLAARAVHTLAEEVRRLAEDQADTAERQAVMADMDAASADWPE